jgi:hypothetical protein
MPHCVARNGKHALQYGTETKQSLKSRDRRQLVWLAAGVVLGIFVARDVSGTAQITLGTGLAAWVTAMLLVLIPSGHPVGARLGAFLAGVFAMVPCALGASPLERCLLACLMALPCLAAATLGIVPPIASFRARLAYLCTWCGTRPVERRTATLDTKALRTLIAATMVLPGAMAVVNAVSAFGLGLPVRWLAGGIMIFAVAEMVTAGVPLVTAAMGIMVPPLFQSPYRSASVSEFWSTRWNIGASQLFREQCFAPLARRSVALALSAAFVASAVLHALLALLALGSWEIALACGAFFAVQPIIIAVERWMRVRRWRPAAGRAWTLAALAITSPLFVEPTLQIVEGSWVDNVLLPTLIVLGFVIVFSGVVSLASLSARPSPPVLA